MTQTIGVGIIARNAEKTIRDCIESFIDEVDQCVVALGGKSTDGTEEILRKMKGVEVYEAPPIYEKQWVKDILGDWQGTSNFAASRNFAFSKLKTDWFFWCDADDIVYQAENLRKLADNVAPEIGGIWFPYHYALDEFKNLTTLYERERLLRARHGWVWRSRIHETVSPIVPCQYVRTDQVINIHKFLLLLQQQALQ